VLIGDDVDRLHVKRMSCSEFHLYSYSSLVLFVCSSPFDLLKKLIGLIHHKK
jgi:hypothetical protein